MKEVKKKYKDTVFRLLYADQSRALSLYNSVNDTHYDDPSILEFNTLENAIYMNVKNDLSFLVANQVNLYEQQSTPSINMPLRDLFYIADILQKMFSGKTIYSSKRIMIPNPNFVVFYNGQTKLPERMDLRLSDSFIMKEDDPSLELKVTVMNINSGFNEGLKKKCSSLHGYVIYVEKIRLYVKTMKLEDAVERAVEECIRENVLREFLIDQKAEVIKMSIYEYDEERELKLIREDEREMGKEEGQERVNSLILLLKEQGRIDDMIKAASDKEFQEKLFQEFGI